MNIFSTSFDYQSRLEKVRKLMDEQEMDAILVHLWPNQYYLSGMYQHMPWYPVENVVHTETPLIIFRDRNAAPIFLITYLTGNGLKEGTWIEDVRFVDRKPFGKHSWQEYTAEALREKGVDQGTIGIEEEVCAVSTYRKLQSALPKAKFKKADEIFQIARIVKEPEEIDLIRQSVKVAQAGLIAGKAVAEVGVLESEIQKAAEIEMKRKGAIREVETMVQSGIRTANHRAFGANWKKIEKNDLVMIDIGCIFKGYGSDLTRTWVAGEPTDAQKKIAEDIFRTHEKIIEAMKPGAILGEIKAMGRNEMKKAGYIIEKGALPSGDECLGGVTIHGIGMGPMHDPPHVEYEDTALESGMTVAVAGGVRHAEFTIRFEDNVVVVPNGIEKLNDPMPWEL